MIDPLLAGGLVVGAAFLCIVGTYLVTRRFTPPPNVSRDSVVDTDSIRRAVSCAVANSSNNPAATPSRSFATPN